MTNLTNTLLLIFLLAAFAIGITATDMELATVHTAIDNASSTINNITLDASSSTSKLPMEGIFLVIEKYIHFAGTFCLEIFRTGVIFGHQNPDYFSPEFIVKIVQLIIILMIISLLIKPLFYLIIFIVMLIIYLKDKRQNHKKKKGEKRWKTKN